MWGAFSYLGEFTSTIEIESTDEWPSATALVNKPLQRKLDKALKEEDASRNASEGSITRISWENQAIP